MLMGKLQNEIINTSRVDAASNGTIRKQKSGYWALERFE
jgi:hypothetical protein